MIGVCREARAFTAFEFSWNVTGSGPRAMSPAQFKLLFDRHRAGTGASEEGEVQVTVGKFALAAIGAVTVLAGTSAQADSIVLDAQDAFTITYKHSNQNYTLVPADVFANESPGFYSARGAMTFDLSGLAGKSILSASVVFDAYMSGSGTVGLFAADDAIAAMSDLGTAYTGLGDGQSYGTLTMSADAMGVVLSLNSDGVSALNNALANPTPVFALGAAFTDWDPAGYADAYFTPTLTLEVASASTPLPAAVWGGMSLMGGMGLVRAIRRKGLQAC
jgi:hypothetical protein